MKTQWGCIRFNVHSGYSRPVLQPRCPPGPQLCLPLLFSSQSFFFFLKLSPLFSWPHRVTSGILIPQPGIEPPPTPPSLEGGILTTGPPGKTSPLDLAFIFYSLSGPKQKVLSWFPNKRRTRNNQNLVPKIKAKGYKPSNKVGGGGAGHRMDCPDRGQRLCL